MGSFHASDGCDLGRMDLSDMYAGLMNGQTGAISARLERIAAELGKVAADLGAPPAENEGETTRARRLLAERRALNACLPEAAAAEAAWAMLLVLFVEADGRPLSAKALAIAAEAPASTAQRWLDQLAGAGLVDRAIDPADRRRVELSLTAAGRGLVSRCLLALALPPR